MEFLAANWLIIVLAIAVVALLVPWSKVKANLPGQGEDSPAKKLIDATRDVLDQIKKDAKLSVPNRAAICTSLILIDTAVEVLPAESQKTTGRDSVKSLGSIFIVTPDEAPKA